MKWIGVTAPSMMTLPPHSQVQQAILAMSVPQGRKTMVPITSLRLKMKKSM